MIELKTSQRPITNIRTPIITNNTNMPIGRTFPIKTFMRLIKRTPECIGIGMRITKDIFTEISFTAISDKKTGRPASGLEKEKKARDFVKRENYRHKLQTSLGLDWVFTGDGYKWHGISASKIKESIISHYKTHGLELKDIDYKQFLDEDLNNLAKVEIIPSSTVEIVANATQIIKYRQWVTSNDPRDFRPDEVIHAKFMSLDGDPHGFTPMVASSQVVDTLSAIRDYNYFFFKNGGVPDKIFKFPKEMANSPNFKAFEQVLQKYKQGEQRHGNMLIAGEVEIEDLNKFDKDMEFRQHAIYSTGVLAFAFNMPPDTISSILGVDIKSTAIGSDLEDSGYQDNITSSQEYWENLLNIQFWNPFFGVDIHFKRKLKQNQIRVIQSQIQFLSVMEGMIKRKVPVSDEYFMQQLQVPREFITPGKIDRTVEETTPMGVSPFSKPVKSENQQAASQRKRLDQRPQADNKPPTGF